MSDAEREALVRELARRGRRAFTAEQYTRQGMLDAVRENRRRHACEPSVQFAAHAAEHLAREITQVVDLPPADIATVLLAAGGAAGLMAELHHLDGTTVAGILQATADELDQQAKVGEQP
ncbi:hypothetical protein ME763_31940 [Streptomyces murinus]|uniref:hypothetical protein n=1 Tax=Streptomyces murinus TaxID=33900 RepID=UPI000A1E001D|nr:hypothetical protein [Streptomyces murinus]WDO09903.1 hypothetical protein ME763_31940 [Streptomyces murinus]